MSYGDETKKKLLKAADHLQKARALVKDLAIVGPDVDVAFELHNAVHDFINVWTPAAGGDSDWQIKWMHPNALKDGGNPYAGANEHTLMELAHSIRDIGMINAIEADPDGVIITGHKRHAASILGGIALVPVKIVKGLTASQRIKRQVTENWTQRKGMAQSVNPMLLVTRMAQDEEGK